MTPEEREIVDMALEIATRHLQYATVIDNCHDTRRVISLFLADFKAEAFGCLFLTQKHAVIANELLFHGTINGATVHTRIIAQRALQHNAAALICYHNHPSGVAEPSKADEEITRRIREALALVDVRLIDHIVIGGTTTVSFAERNLL